MSHCRCGKLYPWSIGKTPAALNVTADHGSVDRNWYGANAVTIHPAAGGGQVPRQPARLKSAPPEGSAAPGRFFMRPAVGARGSFALSGVFVTPCNGERGQKRGSWIAGIVFYLLFFPARFKSGRPHHIPYPVNGTTKRMMVFYTLSPHHRELAGVSFAPAPAGGPGRLCACVLLFFVLRGGDCGKPAYRQTKKENCCRLS